MHITYNQHLKEYARNLRNNMTFAERNLWQMLKGKQIYGFDFHRQKPIGNFIADFYCYALKLVIEVDGITHEDKKVQINDKRKDEYFTELGLTVMRFTDDEVLGNSDLVEKRIREYAKKHDVELEETHPRRWKRHTREDGRNTPEKMEETHPLTPS